MVRKIKIEFEEFKEEKEVSDLKGIHNVIDDILLDLETYLLEKHGINGDDYYTKLYLE